MKTQGFWILMLSAIVFVQGCGPAPVTSGTPSVTQRDGDVIVDDIDPLDDFSKKPDSMTDEEFVTMKAVDTYCRACHGLGDIRFIYSDNVLTNWEYIKAAKFDANKSWLQAIYDVLDWPTADAPEYGSSREGNKEWMPIGAKRQHLADNMINGRSLREVILETLQKELQKQ